MRLAGKTAIVTGSTRGIGRAVAVAYAREGARVVVHGTTQAGVDTVVAEIAAAGGEATGCACRLGTREASASLVTTALETFGGLDILVNNAAIGGDPKLLDLTEETFDELVDVNLKGTFLTTQEAVRRAMAPQNHGKIINVSSHAGFRGAVNKTAYAATKMGVLGMTLVWANELARHHINVNCIAPAALTEMMGSIPEKRLAGLRTMFERNSVIQRVPVSEDCAPSFVFLASDDADYLTGQILQANGMPVHLL